MDGLYYFLYLRHLFPLLLLIHVANAGLSLEECRNSLLSPYCSPTDNETWLPGNTYSIGWNKEYNLFATQKFIDIYLFRDDNPNNSIQSWKSVDNNLGEMNYTVPADFQLGSNSLNFYFIMLPAGASSFAITATRQGPLFRIPESPSQNQNNATNNSNPNNNSNSSKPFPLSLDQILLYIVLPVLLVLLCCPILLCCMRRRRKDIAKDNAEDQKVNEKISPAPTVNGDNLEPSSSSTLTNEVEDNHQDSAPSFPSSPIISHRSSNSNEDDDNLPLRVSELHSSSHKGYGFSKVLATVIPTGFQDFSQDLNINTRLSILSTKSLKRSQSTTLLPMHHHRDKETTVAEGGVVKQEATWGKSLHRSSSAPSALQEHVSSDEDDSPIFSKDNLRPDFGGMRFSIQGDFGEQGGGLTPNDAQIVASHFKKTLMEDLNTSMGPSPQRINVQSEAKLNSSSPRQKDSSDKEGTGYFYIRKPSFEENQPRPPISVNLPSQSASPDKYGVFIVQGLDESASPPATSTSKANLAQSNDKNQYVVM